MNKLTKSNVATRDAIERDVFILTPEEIFRQNYWQNNTKITKLDKEFIRSIIGGVNGRKRGKKQKTNNGSQPK